VWEQCVAVCCSSTQFARTPKVLHQCVAVCCSVLQCVAVFYSEWGASEDQAIVFIKNKIQTHLKEKIMPIEIVFVDNFCC